jgi:hypothetical protein
LAARPPEDKGGTGVAIHRLRYGEEAEKMPAKSKAQQKAAGAALSAKRGDTPKSELKGPARSMFKMSETKLEEFAGTRRKGKPEHAD